MIRRHGPFGKRRFVAVFEQPINPRDPRADTTVSSFRHGVATNAPKTARSARRLCNKRLAQARRRTYRAAGH
jgi:hypothetical protein